ncbi:hypothetical protein ELZ69_16905 [Salmonella enterica subsp. enterica serovar Moero]|uniref:Uncharacterized protein n=1 Tax=Salmonella enterica subsp. enterica serovar Moero TaxID=2500154 RepID=A0A3T0BP94_SALET|nr:hypothetical protein ELZ69_16905 [Salmonella enterica subsp. enterica serovar Moero]
MKSWNRWCNNASLSDGVELVRLAILTMVNIARPDKARAPPSGKTITLTRFFASLPPSPPLYSTDNDSGR